MIFTTAYRLLASPPFSSGGSMGCALCCFDHDVKFADRNLFQPTTKLERVV